MNVVGIFIIIPAGVVTSYRKRVSRFAELNPIPLANGTEFILPLAVLTDPAFDSLKPSLNSFQQREVTHDELVQAEP